MKRIRLLLLALLLLPWPTGCLGALDVSDCAYVESIGFSRGDTLRYRIVLQCAMAESGKEDSASLQMRVLSAEGRTLFEAIDALNAGLPLKLRFSRTALLLVDTALLRDGELPSLLDFSLGRLDIASDVRVMAAEGELDAILDGLTAEADPSFSKMMRNVDALERYSGTVFDVRARDVYEALHAEPIDLVLPLLGLNDPQPQPDSVGGEVYPMQGGALLTESVLSASLAGSAILSGERMVGTLSAFHTQLCGMARGDFTEGRVTLYHPAHGTLSLLLRVRKPPRVRTQGDTARVSIYLDATPEQPQIPDEDATWLSETLTDELERTLFALQALQCDAMALSLAAMRAHPFSKLIDWHAQYGVLTVTFEVDVRWKDGGGA